jgi:biopolymer transport protein ExbD
VKLSRRALRKVRRVRKQAAVTSINLVSMIDIFTILVIYLLVNTAAVQIVGAEQVDLPQSIALEPPREIVSVIVTTTDILVDGEPVLKVAELPKDQAVLASLRERLLQASPLTPAQAKTDEDGGEINILADKSIPYSLLKKVMATAADARFAKISLGVVPSSGGG